MLKKGNKLYSILTGKCPKCHGESMYVNKNPYIITKTLKINDTCSRCHTKYRLEPSFFYGAMYVSYAVSIAFAVIAFIISYLIFGFYTHIAFLSIVGTLVIFMPIIMRLSRNIWINIFVKYDKSLVKGKDVN